MDLTGSGLDMVGCHRGQIIGNTFKNLGSNAIQAKGGTSDIEILRNTFENGSARALNLGKYRINIFRPQMQRLKRSASKSSPISLKDRKLGYCFCWL
ncbi:MAG: hypothetical protein IPN86_17905 [Saprospiraceae bacterium]|nr:hypothetical protein [Saprospiraceae bacterium]